jgi:hypothetical protein
MCQLSACIGHGNAGTFTERLRITSAGLVGIGTSSPSNLLHIAGTGTDLTGLRIVNTQHQAAATSTAGLKLGITNSAGQRNCRIQAREEAVDSNAIALDFFTSNADAVDGETVKMTVLSSGNVGIGTTTPQQKQHIHVDSSAGSVTQYTNSTTGSAAGDGFLVGLDSTEDGLLLVKETNSLIFGTSNTERARIDSSGRLLVGTSSARSNYRWAEVGSDYSPSYQVEGSGANANQSISITNVVNDNYPPILFLGKSRGTSVGSNTVVPQNERIGQIVFAGNDGTRFLPAARIEALVDGTPGANDMPGRLVFSTTADGSNDPTERMRIDSTGCLIVNDTAQRDLAGQKFQVKSPSLLCLTPPPGRNTAKPALT